MFLSAEPQKTGKQRCSIVPRLSAALTRSLFREDAPRHWQDFQDYDTPVFVPTAIDADK